jgi:uncharacterized protein (DUF3084 family)
MVAADAAIQAPRMGVVNGSVVLQSGTGGSVMVNGTDVMAKLKAARERLTTAQTRANTAVDAREALRGKVARTRQAVEGVRANATKAQMRVVELQKTLAELIANASVCCDVDGADALLFRCCFDD